MRYLLSTAALALVAGAARGQQAATSTAAPAAIAVAPECIAPVTSAAPPAPSAAAAAHDSLCLTRRDAIARALVANPQLQVASAQTQQARARKVQGVAMPDPSFSAEWDGARGPFGTGGTSSAVYGASVTIPFFDKFRLNGQIGNADIHSNEADSVLVHQTIASATSQTYDSLLQALRHHSDLHEADSLATDFAKKTQARFDAGTVARLDVVNAQVAVAQAENALISNGRDIANARASLNRLLGRPLGAPLAAADTLGTPAPLPGFAVLEAAALRNRPELKSLAQQQLGARATTALAREFWYPDLTVGISKDYATESLAYVSTPGLLTTALSFPIPILYWNHSKGEIAQDKSYEDQLAASYRDAEAQVGQDLRISYSTAATALLQAVFIRDQLLPAARDAYRIASASYALGGSSALDVNAARTALVTAESQYTDALAAANSARADLERAVGSPLATFATGASQ